MLSHPCVEVMCHCRPVLRTSHPAWPCSNFAYILGLSSQALACLVGACDIIDDIGVFTGDALLHWPRLSNQGARVRICVGWMAQAWFRFFSTIPVDARAILVKTFMAGCSFRWNLNDFSRNIKCISAQSSLLHFSHWAGEFALSAVLAFSCNWCLFLLQKFSNFGLFQF